MVKFSWTFSWITYNYSTALYEYVMLTVEPDKSVCLTYALSGITNRLGSCIVIA